MESNLRTEKCREVFSQLSEYLNLELPPDVCRDIEAHISACSPCIEFVESLRRTVELCRHYQPGELPEPLARSVRDKLWEAYKAMLETRQQQH
jgi:hypothetical protein